MQQMLGYELNGGESLKPSQELVVGVFSITPMKMLFHLPCVVAIHGQNEKSVNAQTICSTWFTVTMANMAGNQKIWTLSGDITDCPEA